MSLARVVWPSSRLQKLALVLGSALILYTLLGFFFLPVALRHMAESTLSARLQREVRIEQVRFNPSLLGCEIKGLSVAMRSGDEPWIDLERLQLNLQAASLFKRALVLSRLRLDRPRILLTRDAEAGFNFSDLLSREGDAPPRPGRTEPLRFSLNNIEVQGGSLELIDRLAQARHTVANLSFSLPMLSNFPHAVETFVEPHLSAEVNSMSIDLGGRTKPFSSSRQSRFELGIEDLNLAHYLAYLPGERNFDLVGGSLSTNLRLTYAAPSQEAPYLGLAGTLQLENLRLSSRGTGEAVARIPALRVEVAGGNLLAGDLHLTEVALFEPQLSVIRSAEGRIILPKLGPRPRPERGPSAAAQTGASADREPFALALDRFELVDGTLRLTDRAPGSPFRATLSPVQCRLSRLKTDSATPAAFELDLRSDQGEALTVNGSLSLRPLAITARTELTGLRLSRYAPYYEPFFAGTVAQGGCSLAGKAGGRLEEGWNLQVEGLQADIRGLAVTGGAAMRSAGPEKEQDRPVLSWDSLGLLGLDWSLDPLSMRLQEFELAGLQTRVVIYPNGESTIGRIFPAKPAPEASPPGVRSRKERSWLSVGRVQLTKGSLELID